MTIDGNSFTLQDREAVERLKLAVLSAVRDGPEWIAIPATDGLTSVLVSRGSSAFSDSWDAPDELDDLVFPDLALAAGPDTRCADTSR